MNDENLKPGAHQLTVEEQSRGGKASGKARHKKKQLKESMKLLLSLPVTDNDGYNELAMMGVPIEDMDNMMLMTLGLFRAAAAGNVQAYREARDLIGESDDLDKKLKRVQLAKIKAETEEIRRRSDDGDGFSEEERRSLADALTAAETVWRDGDDETSSKRV